jgi:hypothetical protein
MDTVACAHKHRIRAHAQSYAAHQRKAAPRTPHSATAPSLARYNRCLSGSKHMPARCTGAAAGDASDVCKLSATGGVGRRAARITASGAPVDRYGRATPSHVSASERAAGAPARGGRGACTSSRASMASRPVMSSSLLGAGPCSKYPRQLVMTSSALIPAPGAKGESKPNASASEG